MEEINIRRSPTVAIMQWKHEIETHSEGMKVLIWHGQARDTNTKELKKYDVVRFFSLSLDLFSHAAAGVDHVRGPGELFPKTTERV